MFRSDRGQKDPFVPLVFGAVALVVVSIVLLIGMDIAGHMADPGFAEAARETTGPQFDGDFMFRGLIVLATLTIVVLVGAALATAPGLSLPRIKKYPITTIGVSYRHETTEMHLYDAACIDCDRRLRPGERRDWAKEFALFGVPVYTYAGGTHYYCADCADPMGLRQIHREARA